MDRTYASGAAETPPAPPALPSSGYPQTANPGIGVQATKPGPWWFHMITEELRAVIAAAGITPNHTDVSQLATAIRRLIDGGDYKPSARVATTANIALTGEQTIDGVAVVAGDRVLVKDQTAGAENGIYVAATGAWARAEDANSAGDLTSGILVPVESGTANVDTIWMLTTDGAITIGTTALAWQIKSGDASTVRKGLVQLATNAESQTLTDALKALTPMTLAAALQGANQNLAANGYQKLPGGFILQWGTYISSATAGGSSTITFPLGFTTACWGVFGIPVYGTTSAASVWIFGVPTQTGVSLSCSVASLTCFYFAIGK